MPCTLALTTLAKSLDQDESETAVDQAHQPPRIPHPVTPSFQLAIATTGASIASLAGPWRSRNLTPTATPCLVHLAYPGETLGYRSFLRPRRAQRPAAEAIEPSFVCHIETRNNSPNCWTAIRELGHSISRAHITRELEGACTTRSLTVIDPVLESATASSTFCCMVLVRRHGSHLRIRRLRDCSRLPLEPAGSLASMVGTRPETLSRIITRIGARWAGRIFRA